MAITAWLLVASAALNQPNYPPFATEQDCALVKQMYLRNRNTGSAQCVPARVWINAQR
jgi:hypothetical protein